MSARPLVARQPIKVECDAETYTTDDNFRTHMGDTISREDVLDLVAEGKATVIEWSDQP